VAAKQVVAAAAERQRLVVVGISMDAVVEQTVQKVTDRNSGLGASDAAAAVGLSKWTTPVELYLEKIGAVEPDIDAQELCIEMGVALEPLVLSRFSRKAKLSVTAQQKRVPDPNWPTRWVTLDALSSDGGMVEAKTAGIADRRDWGDELEDDAVPMQYYLQAQHGMACTGLPHTWMPLLILNRQFRIYRIRRDDELIEQLTAREKEFWTHVETRVPPEPTSSDDAALLWPRDTRPTIVATPEIVEVVAQLKARKAEYKAMEKEIEALSLEVKKHMAEHSELVSVSGSTLCTWRKAKDSMALDKDAFAAAHPALYRQYEVPRAGSRRLLIK
jgi:putative phage-type endonuclease